MIKILNGDVMAWNSGKREIKEKLEFSRENFDNLTRLHEAAIELAELAYTVSKSDLSNVAENLKKLNDRGYQFRNERFSYPLRREDA